MFGQKREGVDGGCRRRFRHNPTKCRGALRPPLDRWEGIGLVWCGHADDLKVVSDLRLHAHRRAIGADTRFEPHLAQDLCNALVVFAITSPREIEVEHASRRIDVEFCDEMLTFHARWSRERRQEELDRGGRIVRPGANAGPWPRYTSSTRSDSRADAASASGTSARRPVESTTAPDTDHRGRDLDDLCWSSRLRLRHR